MHSIASSYARLTQSLEHAWPVVRIAEQLTRTNAASIKTLHGSAVGVCIATLWNLANLPFVVLCADDSSAEDLSHDLGILIGTEHTAGIRGAQKHSALEAGGILHHDHIDGITRLKTQERFVLIASASSLALKLPNQENLNDAQRKFTRGSVIPFQELVTEFALSGFERTDYVAKPGDYAVRGGIIDVFAGGWDNPLRFEFWGDTIESIREFEPLAQRSIREHESVSFVARIFHEDDTDTQSSLIDHIPANALIVQFEPEAIFQELYKREIDVVPETFELFKTLRINPIGETDVTTVSRLQPTLNASIEALLMQSGRILQGTQNSNPMELYIGADGQNNIKRLRDLCENVAESVEDDDPEKSLAYSRTIDQTRYVRVALSTGFIWDDVTVACFTEHQVFNRARAQKRPKKADRGISLKELQQLRKGDYVVHEDKGVGQFDGLHTITIAGSQQECVKLIFAGGDALYVHMNYVHKLGKFTAEEGSIPKLSKLGSAEWERKKAKAKKRIKDIARDLIKLYAERKSQPGFAFPPDTVWQKEFEASFQYEDTPDQAKATAEIKVDMEQATPMDRLVCGDVGFGKTEVAIRAAFKAAQTGKQVAVLVPTTILAQQHAVTFRDRLSRYPVKVEVLSRFRTKSEQTAIIEGLQKGTVDILVGTHRLLSKDVQWNNLGLLIIDEEHRFGVGAKEKLRQIRASIDTLTLTATPIPRTLNFSLMGARDLSVMETPPRNRLPITTEILQWNDDILREAILTELDRGGQIFIVTDRISDMDKLSMRVKMLVPSLRIAIGHGQMEAEELEDVMEGFLERKYDVLIATKIIESGLDIPNANTMLIDNADNFGLAELYQLRGRVGRSNTQAYCYLIIPPPHTLSRTALRRLQALEEHTDLGSGFQLAMRDLEIRGAGNLLGGEQSGFILDMGFELYQKILDEAVQELRHDEFSGLFGNSTQNTRSFENEDVAIELSTDALIPKGFIPSDTDRYEVYKRLYNAHDLTEVDEVYANLRDRFGTLPQEVEELLFAVRLRIAALPTGVLRVNVKPEKMLIEFPPEDNQQYYEQAFPKMLPIITGSTNVRFVQQQKRLFIEVLLGRSTDALDFLQELAQPLTNPAVEQEQQQ